MKNATNPNYRKTGRFSSALWAIVIVLGYSTVVACSGGSGGSDGSGNNAGALSYTGVRTPAQISEGNSDVLIGESLQGALTSDSMIPFAALDFEADQVDIPGSTRPVLALHEAFAETLLRTVPQSRQMQTASIGPNAATSDPMPGDCGGSATYRVDSSSGGVYSGSLLFNAYCTGGITISGAATFLYRLNQAGDFFEYFRFTVSNLTTTAFGESHTMNGSLACDFDGSDVLISVDMVQSSGSTGLTYWLEDYTIETNGSQTFVSGRFYDPDEGYVEFETVEPLIISGSDPYPSDGAILFTGAPGIHGLATSVRLEAVSATEYQFTADWDGDGIFEYDSGVNLWETL